MTESRFRGRPAFGEGAPSWWFAYLVRGTIGAALRRLYRVRCVGWERIPDGGAILAGNHVSYLDPALLWCVTPRPTHFVAKAELWETGWLGWLLDHFWAFPVKRGTADREMISTASSLLEHGEPLGMFPEGTRQAHGGDELGEAHGGVAFLAIRAGVPVVPIGIAGTEKALPRGAKFPRFIPVTMVAGTPVHPGQFEGTRKERVEAMTAEIMRCIGEVRDEARGVER